MPSQKQESSTTPWKGYQPYLVGEGPIPSWLTQGAPTGLTDAMAADMAARAAGAEGSWLKAPPINFGGGGPGVPGGGPFVGSNVGGGGSPGGGGAPVDQGPQGWFYGGTPGLESIFHTDWANPEAGSIFFGGGE